MSVSLALPSQRVDESRVLSMVLAGGEGKRLAPLTNDRAKPAVPFGGHYRLIDFVLSNLVNGGYRKIVVLTQYKSHSLDVHLSRTWRLSAMLGNYVVGIPAQMRRGPHWYSGSADAIFQNLNLIDDERPTHVMVFGADHIYRMDPRPMLKQHLRTGAGLTVAGIRVPRREATAFGVIDVAASPGSGGSKIRGFLEKPDDPPGLPDSPDETLASMGNYLFDADLLRELVTTDAATTSSRHDMGGDIVPAVVAAGDAHVYDFSTNVIDGETERDHAYWRDVGTLDSYFDAHMDLVAPEPVFNLYNYDWPIYTAAGVLPPAKLTEDHGRSAEVFNSVICNGAIVSGSQVREAVLSPRATVAGAEIERAVLLDGVEVGRGAVLRNTIIDKNVIVPPGLQIGVDPAADLERFGERDNCRVTDSGIVVIGKNDDLSDLA